MYKDSRPLVVLFGQIKDEILTFVGRQGYLEWSWHPELFSNILMQCNGMQDIREISKILGCPQRLLLQMLSEAESYGIVVDSRNLAIQFHQDSENPAQFESNLEAEEVRVLHDSSLPWLGKEKGFPMKRKMQGKLTGLINRRKSCRAFGQGIITKNNLSELLLCAYSNCSVPSAGDLRPVLPYVYLFKPVEDLNPGLYEYQWDTQGLFWMVDQPTQDEIKRAIPDESVLENVICMLVFTVDLKRVTAKYGNRGYRFALLEAGHCAQNVYLWGAERNYGILEYGAYLDRALLKLLRAESQLSVATVILVGKPLKKSEANVESFKNTLEILSNEPAVTKGFVKNSTLLNFSKQISSRSYAVCKYFLSQDIDDHFAWGNGSNLYEARLKAIVEGMERYYSSRIRVEKVSSANKLLGKWIDPRKVSPLTENQYALDVNLEPFNEKKKWQWVKGREHRTGFPVWFPIDLVYYPISQINLGRKLCTYTTSSGVAAHLNSELAINSALLELIERDAFIKAWYVGLDGAVSHSPQNLGPEISKYVSHFCDMGFEVTFVQIPTDRGAKVVVCLIRERGGKRPKLGIGAGADFSELRIAAEKAFYEAEFLWLTQSDEQPYIRSPRSVKSVSNHLDFYRSKSRIKELNRWFEVKEGSINSSPCTIDNYTVFTVNLYQSARICIERVIEPSLVPMSFGFGLEHYSHAGITKELRGKDYRFPGQPHCFA